MEVLMATSRQAQTAGCILYLAVATFILLIVGIAWYQAMQGG